MRTLLLALALALAASALNCGSPRRPDSPPKIEPRATTPASTSAAQPTSGETSGIAPVTQATGQASASQPATQPASTGAPWRDLFDGKTLVGWRPSGYGGEGEATVEDGKLVIPLGERLSGLTYTGEVPTANYEVELEARRMSGTDFFVGLTFPVNQSHASLILGGWGGSVCGISSLDGEDANNNETRKLMRFKKEQWYKVRLRVEPPHLRAWVDDQPVVDVNITGKAVGIREEIAPSKPLGLATFATAAELRSVRVREIAGEGEKRE